jgi:hypothetical protein
MCSRRRPAPGATGRHFVRGQFPVAINEILVDEIPVLRREAGDADRVVSRAALVAEVSGVSGGPCGGAADVIAVVRAVDIHPVPTALAGNADLELTADRAITGGASGFHRSVNRGAVGDLGAARRRAGVAGERKAFSVSASAAYIGWSAVARRLVVADDIFHAARDHSAVACRRDFRALDLPELRTRELARPVDCRSRGDRAFVIDLVAAELDQHALRVSMTAGHQ